MPYFSTKIRIFLGKLALILFWASIAGNVYGMDLARSDKPLQSKGKLPSKLSAELREVLEEFDKKNLVVSLAVSKAGSYELLFEHNVDLLLNPASNVKLVTSLAALKILGPGYRFKTEIFKDGAIKKGTLHGNLYIRGLGDPSIVSERMQKIAREVSLRGISKITGKVIFDDSFFDQKLLPKGYDREPKKYKVYAAPIGALSFNYNSTSLFMRGGRESAAVSLLVDPPVSYIRLIRPDSALIGPETVITIPGKGETLLKVSGYLRKSRREKRYYRSIFHPGRYFASALIYFLKMQGVILGDDYRRGKIPKKASILFTSRSDYLSDIINDLNVYSNNFIAEMLVKTIGAFRGQPASFEAGLDTIRKFLVNKVGFKAGSFVLGNGSGLNDVNRFSARQFAKILSFAYNDFEIAADFVGSLSVAGTQGTISERMGQPKVKRRLRAKTGSLRGVSALSGYVATKNGAVLAFSLLVSGKNLVKGEVWPLENKVGALLAMANLEGG